MSDSLEPLRADLKMLATLLLPQATSNPPLDENPLALEPSEEDALRIRAYLILAHSGIEEMMENQILQAVREVVSEPNTAPPAIALSLVAQYADDLKGQNRGKVPGAYDIAGKLAGLYESKVIKPNNGIRRKSVVAMCKPLGLDLDDLAPDIESALTALDTLGAKRGAAAHSLRGATQEVIHAHQARAWVEDALVALGQLLPLLLAKIRRRELIHVAEMS
ncbi:hypothetical protein AB0J77_28075 [Micromonospora tulbaghiae]|uniref:hypothetical protein n=1 Tax=Micromonospora tulbaghiae TaxID=479978 RepID=UPI003447FF92